MTQTFADQALTLDLIGDYAILTLNQPAKRNAMTKAMWSALPQACAAVEAAQAAKVLIVRGAGEHFAAGADISEFEVVYGTREAATAYRNAVSGGVDALAGLSKPTIAMIRGACVGGGLALAWQWNNRASAKLTWARRAGSNPNPSATGNDQDGTLLQDRLWASASFAF